MLIIDSPLKLPLALDNDVFTHLRNKQPYVLERIKKHLVDIRRLPVIPSLVIFEANFGIQNAFVKNSISDKQTNPQIQIEAISKIV